MEKTAIYRKQQIEIRPVKSGPCVFIIMPFEPKMSVKSKLEYRLKKAIEIAEGQLLEQYPAFTAGLIVKKLKALAASLDYSTYKKSIALCVSSGIEKVYYLNIEVQEKIVVDHSFEIRDIVLNKELQQEYLLLILSNEKEKLFLGKSEQLIPLVINAGDNIAANKNDIADNVSNFSDPQHKDEILIKKFIRHVDDGLSIILKAYPLPLFIACTKETMRYFRQLSKNIDHVVEYLPDNYEDATEDQLKTLVQPYLDDWQKIKEKYLLLQLEIAMSNGKCVVGIKDVYKAASQKRGRLLIVEKNYFSPAFIGEKDELNPEEESMQHNLIYIKDAVDDIIEKILENGGDIEFVSDGLLKDYMHIALIQSADGYHQFV
ncbi:MAG: hypothetical protein ABJA71_02025 [Ginsengibacter sp.]